MNSLKPLTVQPDRKPRLNSVVSAKLFRRGNSLGDPTQCDNQRLDKTNNGLVYTIQKMKGYYTDIITMLESEGVRSELSKIASLKM